MSANPLILDYSVKDHHDLFMSIRSNIEANKMVFEFPEGFADIPLIEECRAVSEYGNPEAFDLLYDITMQFLAGKPVVIKMRDEKDVPVEVCSFMVTNRYMNLRGVEFLDSFPIVVMWMVDVIICSCTKKYPTLLQAEKARGSKNVQGIMTKKKKK